MSAVSNQPVNPTTYLDRLTKAFEHNTSLQPLATELSQRISKPLDILSAHVRGFVLNNKLDELRPCLTEGCEIYEGISKGHAVAKQALEQFRSTLASVYPEKLALPVTVIKHMEELDVLAVYTEKEAACLTARTALSEIVTKLADLVKNSETFMESMKGPLNTVAYEVKRMEKQTGVLDLLPSRGHYYFDAAFAAYQNPVKPAESTTTAAVQEAPPQDRELVEVKTAPKAETPKAKNAVAELAASLS